MTTGKVLRSHLLAFLLSLLGMLMIPLLWYLRYFRLHQVTLEVPTCEGEGATEGVPDW